MSQKTTATVTPHKPFATRYGRYKDLCEALKVSRTTIWRWQSMPDFPVPKKRGNTVLFDLEAVDVWLNGVEGA